MGVRLAKELGVVLPVSFYEKEVNNLYNSIACIDADGTILGIYRKTHIPDDHYYQEKFYFTPGDTGFRIFETRYGKIGIGICWDQWFPERHFRVQNFCFIRLLSVRSQSWNVTACRTGGVVCRAMRQPI